MKSVASALLFACAYSFAGEPPLAPTTPPDQPIKASISDRAIAPYVAQARASYPRARDRFLLGLPIGERLFLVTRIYDSRGQMEQVFVLVSRIKGPQVIGRIASDIVGVSGVQRGNPYEFPESAIVDWVITKPDGSEEGNFVGRFLDKYERKQ